MQSRQVLGLRSVKAPKKDTVKSVTSTNDPHKGWADAVSKIAASDDDESLIPDVFDDEKFDEWDDGAIKEDCAK